MDSGAACHAWPWKAKLGSSLLGTFLTATGAPVESQGTLEVNIQLVAVHGEAITVKAVFELLPAHRPILSVGHLVDKGFAVVMGNDQGNKLSENGRRDTSSQIQWCVPCPFPCDSGIGAVSTGGSTSME